MLPCTSSLVVTSNQISDKMKKNSTSKFQKYKTEIKSKASRWILVSHSSRSWDNLGRVLTRTAHDFEKWSAHRYSLLPTNVRIVGEQRASSFAQLHCCSIEEGPFYFRFETAGYRWISTRSFLRLLSPEDRRGFLRFVTGENYFSQWPNERRWMYLHERRIHERVHLYLMPEIILTIIISPKPGRTQGGRPIDSVFRASE